MLGFAASAASAAVIDIGIGGWQADGGYGNAGNSFVIIPLPIGAQIVSAEYIDLSYTANGTSWRNELALSLNDSFAAPFYWDTDIAGAPGSPGAYGPVSGPFANPGLFGSGPFTMTTTDLYVTVYDTYNDAGIDQSISSGTIRVTWTPEPASLSLLGLGALAFIRRR
jgi:hypothetical protein